MRASMSSGGGNFSLKLDIDRMFAQRIEVFEGSVCEPTLDGLLGKVVKATFKAIIELSRPLCLHPRPCGLVQADVEFLRTAAHTLLSPRDAASSHTDSLAAQACQTLTSRCCDPDSLSGFTEAQMLQEATAAAVQAAMQKAAQDAPLLGQ
jgi:hypothetical protein